ncbi:hypothetical protein ACJX0J_019023 [Zea mays]
MLLNQGLRYICVDSLVGRCSRDLYLRKGTAEDAVIHGPGENYILKQTHGVVLGHCKDAAGNGAESTGRWILLASARAKRIHTHLGERGNIIQKPAVVDIDGNHAFYIHLTDLMVRDPI